MSGRVTYKCGQCGEMKRAGVDLCTALVAPCNEVALRREAEALAQSLQEIAILSTDEAAALFARERLAAYRLNYPKP